MATPTVSLQTLLESGAHFGHQTHRWNPKMKPYIFGARNGVHILDLSQTVPLMQRALDFIASTAGAGGKVLFVGTKRQAQEPVAEAAHADVIAERKVIVELKSVERVEPVHKKQLLTYLRLTNCRLGLLINFGAALIKDGITRVANGLPEDRD